MQPTVHKQVDLLLFCCGLFVGLVTPLTILSRSIRSDIDTMDCLAFLVDHPLQGVPCVFFAVAGFTLVSVGLNGLRGKHANAQEKFEAVFITAAITCSICIGAFSILFALSKISSFVDYRNVRLAATIIGALVGFHLAASFPSVGSEQTQVVFTAAGGALGFFCAPTFFLFFTAAVLLFFAVPFGSLLLQRLSMLREDKTSIPSHAVSNQPSNDKKINDLRMKIAWVKNQGGVAPHLVSEEVARLQQQIKSLGGTP